MASPLRPTWSIKHTVHLMIPLATQAVTKNLFEGVASHMERELCAKVVRGTLAAHWKEMQRRMNGEKPWTSFVDATARPLTLAATRNEPHYSAILEHYDLAVWEVRGVGISFDILNPHNELGVPCYREDEVLLEVFFEPFSARDRSRSGQPIVREVAVMLARHTDARIVYGGGSTFTSRFYSGFGYASPPISKESRPEQYLWPLSVSRNDLIPGILKASSLPLHLVQQVGTDRTLIQVFEDFDNGSEDDYKASADGLGLRSIWEIQYPETPSQ